MQECCNFLNAFSPSSILTPSGPKFNFRGICRGRRPRRPVRGWDYRLFGRIWNPPLRKLQMVHLTVVGARLVAKTTATSQQSWPARAVQCPTGALIATQPRLRGYSPLGTPKRWSAGKKAKNCRSAAIFLTLFHRLPYCPLRGRNLTFGAFVGGGVPDTPFWPRRGQSGGR